MDERELSAMLEAGMTLAQIAKAVGRHPSTVSYWLGKYGLEAAHAERHRARGPIPRERLEELVAGGMSITELAAACDRSTATVRHWLRRYGLKTLQARRRAERRAALVRARAAGEPAVQALVLQCRRHGRTTFVREGSGYYRCSRCRSEAVASRRRRLKEILVAEAGGRCVACGYDRQPQALQFHHLDRATKEFAVSRRGITLSLDALRAEARKCVLLCANCHAEVEGGALTLSIQ